MSKHSQLIDDMVLCSSEFQQAQRRNIPCVALESTVIAHGLPYRDNLETAYKCEEVIRSEGVVPVTFGIWEGRIIAGMSTQQMEFFARHPEKVEKVNLQNLSYIIARKLYGATTVAATVYLANKMGISLMATGGIGGVHYQVERLMDISADLGALATNPVAVVSSGVKCILDIPKTLEVLETIGVPVVGYRTGYFPLFYSNEPLYQLEQTFSQTVDIGNFLRYHFRVFPDRGVLLANPVSSKVSLNYQVLKKKIQELLKKAEKKEIKGKKVTPFLLDGLARSTENKTLAMNKDLLIDNARLAAKIAKEYQ